MTHATITLDNKTYVVLPRKEYQDLLAKSRGVKLPDYPPAAADGSRPAVEFGRASIAREIITRRLAADWSQIDLAKKAGVRVETISRLEGGKHHPQAETVERIEAAFKKAGV